MKKGVCRRVQGGARNLSFCEKAEMCCQDEKTLKLWIHGAPATESLVGGTNKVKHSKACGTHLHTCDKSTLGITALILNSSYRSG